MSEKCVMVRDLHKHFESGRGITQVLNGVNLDIDKGSSLAVTGPSGSGKSTLLNLLGGMDFPDSGKILINNEDISTYDLEELARFRRQKIGFIFQNHFLLPQCTLLENALLPTLANGQVGDDQIERARSMLNKLGLNDRMDYFPGQCSGGECQRAALVRAVVHKPDLILADEPTGALDQKNAEELVELLLEMIGEYQLTLIVVTHSKKVAEKMGRWLELQSGQLNFN